MFYTVDSLKEHIEPIALNMRLDDVKEIWASGKRTPQTSLKMSMSFGKSKTIMLDGNPVGMYGVCPVSFLSFKGSPWLLGTDILRLHSREFLKGCKAIFPDLIKEYKYLENYVDCRNKTSIRWLKWLGFAIMEPEPYGPFKLPFHRFYMENNHV